MIDHTQPVEATTSPEQGNDAPTPTPTKTAQQRGRASRRKGASGERELCHLLSDLTGYHVVRQVRNYRGDSDLTGVPFWCIEVKRHASVTPSLLKSWWQQAVRQAQESNAHPVLFYRADGQRQWCAVWQADLMYGAASPSTAYDHTVHGSPEAWWRVCQAIEQPPGAGKKVLP